MTDSITNRYGDKIRVGQVWANCDPREEGRTIRIASLDERYAQCEVVTAVGGGAPKIRRVRILIDRLHRTRIGYRLIEDPEGQS